MWYETLYKVLDTINVVILYAIGVPFFLQLIYMLLFWLPKKTYKKTDKINRIAIVIPAHNEEDVIYDTVRLVIEKQKYPKRTKNGVEGLPIKESKNENNDEIERIHNEYLENKLNAFQAIEDLYIYTNFSTKEIALLSFSLCIVECSFNGIFQAQ